MDLVTRIGAPVTWSAFSLLVLLSLILFVRFVWQSSRSNSKVETEFAETLAWVRSLAEVSSRLRSPSSVVSHRARELPWLLRWAARRGAIKSQPGYGPPPPLTPAPPPTWSAADMNTIRWPGNPVRASAPVGFADPWEEIDVTRDVLAGDMRAAANTEDTGLIEPIRAEVVQ